MLRKPIRKGGTGRVALDENNPALVSVIIMKPNLAPEFSRRRSITFEEIQDIVGGYIEIVPKFTTYGKDAKCLVFCNEDGRVLGLPKNDRATAAWGISWEGWTPQHFLVGTVVIVCGTPKQLNKILDGEAGD